MICTQCGEPVSSDLAFCTNCGCMVDNASGTAEVDHANTEQQDIVQIESTPIVKQSEVSADDVKISSQFVERSAYSSIKKISLVSVSILFSIILLASIIIFFAFLMVRPKSIHTVITQTDIIGILDKSGLINEIIKNVYDIGYDINDIDIYSIEAFIDRVSVREELGKVVDRYILAIKEKDLNYHITSKEIIDFLKAIAPDIRDVFGYKLTSDDYSATIDSDIFSETLSQFKVGVLLDRANADIAIPYILFSLYPLIVAGILCVTLLFNIFLLNRKNISGAFLCIGIPITIAGLLLSVVGLLFGPLSGLLSGSELYSVAIISNGYAYLSVYTGLICLGFSIITFEAIYFTARMRKKQLSAQSSSDAKPLRVWRNAGIIVNTSSLIVCSVLAVICLLDVNSILPF